MMGHDTLQQALEEKYFALREDTGVRYASVMEGYGNMVAILNTVEGFFKDCKKEVHKFVPSDSQIAMETTRDQLDSMEHTAVLLSNAALAMAARMRLFRDTVVDIGGGDLLDMMEEDNGWHCQCGTEKVFPRCTIVQQSVFSCGCIAPDRRRKTVKPAMEKPKEGPPKKRKRNIPKGLSLNFEELAKTTVCYECGKTFERLSKEWAYKVIVKEKRRWVCSWKCQRKAEQKTAKNG